MPFLERDNASIYYEEAGSGAPILTVHGLAENGTYWSRSGVTARLAERYRVISMDMRGHARSRVSGEPKGFDVETIAADIGALADHLRLERFHLLSHATGGMAAIRYAMRHSGRLLSLMATDTGSATVPSDEISEHTDTDRVYPRLDPSQNPMAQAYATLTWDAILAGARNDPGPFLNRLDANPEPERVWQVVEDVLRMSDTKTLGEFMGSFYDDPDPRIAQLRGIGCPTLVLLGEHDVMFIKPSQQLAREIPRAKHVVMKGLGHMTAIEDPEWTARELLEFLDELRAAKS
jgi:pimeloyl-ACP methyl ester carboxylesterase